MSAVRIYSEATPSAAAIPSIRSDSPALPLPNLLRRSARLAMSTQLSVASTMMESHQEDIRSNQTGEIFYDEFSTKHVQKLNKPPAVSKVTVARNSTSTSPESIQQCKLCTKSFDTQRGLRIHTTKIHGSCSTDRVQHNPRKRSVESMSLPTDDCNIISVAADNIADSALTSLPRRSARLAVLTASLSTNEAPTSPDCCQISDCSSLPTAASTDPPVMDSHRENVNRHSHFFRSHYDELLKRDLQKLSKPRTVHDRRADDNELVQKLQDYHEKLSSCLTDVVTHRLSQEVMDVVVDNKQI